MDWRRFLRSRSNLAGVGCVGLVSVLWLTGAITEYAPVVMAIAYLAGFMAFWTPAEVVVPKTLGLQRQVDWLRAKTLPRLDGEARELLADLLDHVQALSPRLAEMREQGLLEVEQRTVLRQTVTFLLPNLLNPYLRLPKAYARTRTLANGRTAQQEVTEQLRLLEKQVRAVREAAFSRDTEALLTSGRVLEERFRATQAQMEEPSVRR